MSVKAMTWVFENSPYTLGPRLVHLALADVANDDHDYRLWMLREAIASKAGVSTDTVDRALTRMQAEGYIEKIIQGGGRGKPNEWRLLFPTTAAESGGNKSAATTPQKGRNDTTERAATTREDNYLTQEETNTTQDADADLEKARGKGKDYRFEDAWSAYPKRDGRRIGKRDAREEWKKLSYEDKGRCFRAIKAFQASGTEYPPDMHRWLKHKTWEDWLTPADRAPVGGKAPVKGYGEMSEEEFRAAMRGKTETEVMQAEFARRHANG